MDVPALVWAVGREVEAEENKAISAEEKRAFVTDAVAVLVLYSGDMIRPAAECSGYTYYHLPDGK